MTFKPYLSLLLLAVSAHAQNPAPAKEQPFEFRLTAWNIDLPGLFYEEGGKKLATPVIERALTQPFITTNASGKLVLYTQTLVEGAPVKTPLAQVTLVAPPGKNLVLLWLENSGRYGATVLADDPRTPPPGHLRFVNLTRQPLAFQCNGLPDFTLDPAADKVVPPTRSGVGIGVKVARQRKKPAPDSWELALMTGIPIAADERVTAFIADPDQLALSVGQKSLGDHLEKELLSLFLIRDTVSK
ncbi:MAG TPA: hypothetical protein VIO38_15855 [Rariglobus sp.]